MIILISIRLSCFGWILIWMIGKRSLVRDKIKVSTFNVGGCMRQCNMVKYINGFRHK